MGHQWAIYYLKVDYHPCVIFTCIHTFSCANKIGAIYKSLQVNVEVEQGSNCTFTHDPSYIASIFFDMHVKFICIHKLLNLSAVHHHQMDDEYNGRLSPSQTVILAKIQG